VRFNDAGLYWNSITLGLPLSGTDTSAPFNVLGPLDRFVIFFASGGQGALFEKTAPWTPAKTFY
jgi:hypothetical protein